MPIREHIAPNEPSRAVFFDRCGDIIADDQLDAFVLLGLVPILTNDWDNEINNRLGIIWRFQTDIERYVFLRDLETSNNPLFDSVLNRDREAKRVFFLMSRFMPVVGVGAGAIVHGNPNL